MKQIINQIDYLHSLDRESLAKEINKRAERPVACFVQVNVSGETSKSGVSPERLESFIDELAIYPNVLVVGLMTMAPIEANANELSVYFKRLKSLQEEIAAKKLSFAPCTQGASFVRIGSAFFD